MSIANKTYRVLKSFQKSRFKAVIVQLNANAQTFSTSPYPFVKRPLDLEDNSVEIDNSFSNRAPESEIPSPNHVSEYDGPNEKSINSVTLLGRVGMDPQLRGSEEKPITTFSLATNSTWRNVQMRAGEPEWSTKTEWHNVVVFKPGLRESVFNNMSKGQR